MKEIKSISTILEQPDTLAIVMQSVKAHTVRNGTAVSTKTSEIIIKAFLNNLPNQQTYEYKAAWFELSDEKKVELWAKSLTKVTDYYGNDKSTSEFTRIGLWIDAAKQILEKYTDVLPFEFEHYLTTIPYSSLGEKKDFISYTIPFLTNLVYDYKLQRNLFVSKLQDYKEMQEREQTIKLSETVSLPSYDKLLGIDAILLPMHEVIRAENDNDFVQYFAIQKTDKEVHLQAFQLFDKSIKDGTGMQPIEKLNLQRLLNNHDNIEVYKNNNDVVLNFKITHADLRSRYEVCFRKQVLYNFINQYHGKESEN